MKTNILMGLISGAAVGLAIAYLSSPAGEQTRNQLMKGIKKLADSFGDSQIGEAVKEGFNQEVDELARKGNQLIDNTSEHVKV